MKQQATNDSELKRQAMELLWALGYVVRPELILSEQGPRPRGGKPVFTDLTDIDVIGYGFGPLLSSEAVAVDCGAGARRAGMSRVFWVAGLMEAAGLDRAICVVGRDTEEDHRIAAERLGVIYCSQAEFLALRKAVAEGKPAADFAPYYRTNNEWLSLLASSDQRLSFYLLRDHWNRQWERIPLQLPALVRRATLNLDPSNPAKRFGLIEMCTLLAIAVVRMSSYLAVVRPHDFKGSARAYLLGGLRRANFVESILRKLEEIQSEVQTKLPFEDPNGGGVSIPHLEEVTDVASRFVARPWAARLVPRCLQAIQLADVSGDIRRYAEFAPETTDPVVLKLALEVFRYFGHAANCKDEVARVFEVL